MADRLGYVGFDSNKLTAIAKAFFVSKSCLRFCAVDSEIRFLAFAILSKKIHNCQ